MWTAVVDLLTPPLYPVTVTIFIIWLSGYLVIWLSGYLVIWFLRLLEALGPGDRLIQNLSGFTDFWLSGFRIIEVLVLISWGDGLLCC